MPRPKRLTGTWVHPADGDNYPEELTMKVTEAGPQFMIITWTTVTTGYGEPFEGRVSENVFTFGEGANRILMSTKSPRDGHWSSPHAMDIDRWGVDGTIDHARERMREFFTELGYVKKEER